MSSLMFSQPRENGLFLQGEKRSGDDVRQQNVAAAMAIANVVKSSLGPVGLDKMMVDDIGEVTVTNDGATILSLLDVEHPAGKLLVELAQQQDREVGDGTTSVVIIAAELLRRANELVKHKIHQTTIISGYRLALREAAKYLQENIALNTANITLETLLNCAKTSMSSKVINIDSDFFAKLCCDAVLAVKVGNSYPINAINILKAQGGSTTESRLIKGYALNCTVASQAMKTSITNAKIACLDINFQKYRMPLGVHVTIDDPEQLEKIRQRESEIVLEQVQKVLNAGANVILTTKGIDDLCLKRFIDAGAMAVRRCAREDLVRIAKATGATLLSTLSNLEGEEVFEYSSLGFADEVVQEKIASDECILIKNPKLQSAASLILRGSNEYHLDEMERSIHDVLCVLKRALESGSVVPGGGACETALSVYLENFAISLGSREQLAITEFAAALLSIPKTLAVNAAADASDLIAKLRAFHAAAQSASPTDLTRKAYKNYGLDLMKESIRDNLQAGVLEPTMMKVNSLTSAVEACIAILRIDTSIKLDPEQKQQDPHDAMC